MSGLEQWAGAMRYINPEEQSICRLRKLGSSGLEVPTMMDWPNDVWVRDGLAKPLSQPQIFKPHPEISRVLLAFPLLTAVDPDHAKNPEIRYPWYPASDLDHLTLVNRTHNHDEYQHHHGLSIENCPYKFIVRTAGSFRLHPEGIDLREWMYSRNVDQQIYIHMSELQAHDNWRLSPTTDLYFGNQATRGAFSFDGSPDNGYSVTWTPDL
jgi:hypothetical protein